MKDKKGWIVFGIFVIAAVVAFAIYKAVGTKDETTITGGGKVIKASGGIGSLIGSIFGTSSIGGASSSGGGSGGGIGSWFKGLFSPSSSATSGFAGGEIGGPQSPK